MRAKVGKNVLNKERMLGWAFYFGLRQFEFWALILQTGGNSFFAIN